VPPEGICSQHDKISREKLDIWQIGVLMLDLLTKGLIIQINECRKQDNPETYKPQNL